MKNKKTLSIIVVIALCLVLAGEIGYIVSKQIEKKLTPEYPVFEIISNGIYSCDAQTRTADGIQEDHFKAGLLSPLSMLEKTPFKATLKEFDGTDWLYRFTFHYFFTDPQTNESVSRDIEVIIGRENMQLDGITYELSVSNWDIFLSLVEKNMEDARNYEYDDWE